MQSTIKLLAVNLLGSVLAQHTAVIGLAGHSFCGTAPITSSFHWQWVDIWVLHLFVGRDRMEQ